MGGNYLQSCMTNIGIAKDIRYVGAGFGLSSFRDTFEKCDSSNVLISFEQNLKILVS